MSIPVYVVTGFLDAGKTSFIKEMLNRDDWKRVQLLLVQFESGEEEFRSTHRNCDTLVVPKRSLERERAKIVSQLGQYIHGHVVEEIWIEWNGMTPFSELHAMLLEHPLSDYCHLEKVLHVADAACIETLLGRTGGALPEQIASSDLVLLRGNVSVPRTRRIRKLMRGLNPRVPVLPMGKREDIERVLFRKARNPIHWLFLAVVVLIAGHLAFLPVLEAAGFPANKIINVFLGIILQAFPFLVIGVLLSSAIQVLIPTSVIERRFPKSIPLGMLAAIGGSFLLPVCDCASIPIFRSLVKKGIPLPVAVTFLTATPVVNPVVMLSTYYAFGGDLSVVGTRVVLGIISALFIGTVMAVLPMKKGALLAGGAYDGLLCACGCYGGTDEAKTLPQKLMLFLRHSQAEFLSVGKYLVVGTFLSALIQAAGSGWFTNAQSGGGLVLSMLMMMVVAFVLSLCSSSDAVIAKSFSSQFPMGALMAFLVFGPMMDIKNVMMLSSGFSKRFVLRLLGVSAVVCFAVVYLYYVTGG